MHTVSHDLQLREPLELVSGESATAIEVQWHLLDLARKYHETTGLETLGDESVARAVLDRWEQVLTALESDPSTLSKTLDWVAKLELIDAYRARHDLALDDHRVHTLDLQYHDLRPEKSLFRRLEMQTITDLAAAEAAVTDPTEFDRHVLRGECLKRYPEQIAAANWDSVVFDLGDDPLRRVPMMEPLRGTATHVATLFERSGSAADLLDQLGA